MEEAIDANNFKLMVRTSQANGTNAVLEGQMSPYSHKPGLVPQDQHLAFQVGLGIASRQGRKTAMNLFYISFKAPKPSHQTRCLDAFSFGMLLCLFQLLRCTKA